MNCLKGISRLLLPFLLAIHLCLSAVPCAAEIYRWQDEQGIWHFSDSPTSDAPIQPSPESSIENTEPEPASPGVRAASGAPIEGGLLWRITSSGSSPSYLLGTIHSSDPRVVRLKPAVQQALNRSDRFVMEMEMDASALMTFGTSMLLTDGNDLESLLGADLFGQVLKATGDYGLPEMAVRNLKPWVVMALLSMPKPSGEPILDLVLYQQATTAGKPTAGLESAQEQLSVFEGLSMEDQIDLLKMTLAQLPALPRLMDRLIEAYAADDLNRIADIAAGYKNQSNLEALNRFTFRLNDGRNTRMAQRIIPYLQQGNTFIAVGAMHLAGPSGLISLLRRQGYRVTSVP